MSLPHSSRSPRVATRIAESRRRLSQAGAGIALVSLAGCLPYSAVDHPASPVPLPESYGNRSANETVERAQRDTPWWVDFQDPQLNSLEAMLLEQNLQLRAAWARLSQAEAVTGQAAARRYPQANLSASASRQRQRFGNFESQEFSAFSLSAPLSYELDLFDRLGAEEVATEFDAAAARGEAEALALTLSGQLAEVWFQYLEAHEREALLQKQLEANETFLELTKLRFGQGLSAAIDVHQQAAQVSGTQGQLTLAGAQRQLARHQLALLLGEAPGSDEVPEPASEAASFSSRALPPPPPLGVPADLVQYRPDVRAAQMRVAAADRRVGAAIANWFPSLSLNGSIGFNSVSLTKLFEEVIWNFVGSLTQNLFDGGQRSAEIDLQRAIVSERLDNFAETLLTALHEVENAWVQERQQGVYLESLSSQVRDLGAAVEQARQRYQEGLTDFLPVLTALTAHQNAELQLLTGRREQFAYRIQLYRALGTTWTQSLSPLPLREAEEESDPDSKRKMSHDE